MSRSVGGRNPYQGFTFHSAKDSIGGLSEAGRQVYTLHSTLLKIQFGDDGGNTIRQVPLHSTLLKIQFLTCGVDTQDDRPLHSTLLKIQSDKSSETARDPVLYIPLC